MKGISVIITGATGMVGEGVLLECLNNPLVSRVLIISRGHYDLRHPKLKELIVPDFLQIDKHAADIGGYDGCFFCSGVSSIGMKEEKYTQLTYDTTLAFATSVARVNDNMVFTYVSGSHTDSTGKGKVMWARVKGRTENDLMKIPFRAVYHFRPGALYPFKGQKNWKSFYKFIVGIFRVISPGNVLTMQEVGRAMINCVTVGYPRHILEVRDIRALAVAGQG